MTEAYEEARLVRVRAQVMSRDEGTGGWVALGGGGLANVTVGKCRVRNHRAGGESSSIDDIIGSRLAHAHAPRYEYYIHGKRISDQSVVLSCTIKKDFQYNKVMPTFHHWVTDEKRFGLTFQTAADARAFDKGVRTAIEELLDGLGGAWPSLHEYKKHNPAPRVDDEENNIFECLHLPSDSRSSSENSTASRSQRHQPSRTPFDDASSAASRELLMKQKLAGCGQSDPDKMGSLPSGQPSDELNSYVHLTAVHEYTYPQLGAGGVITTEVTSTNRPQPIAMRDTAAINKGGVRISIRPPPLPDKKPFKPRIQCKYCNLWYLERENRLGSCEDAPDGFSSCINTVSCIKCAHCMIYHCMSDSDAGESSALACACVPTNDRCAKRWTAMALLSLLVPCLWCYPPLRCVYSAARGCHIAGGRHAPNRPSLD